MHSRRGRKQPAAASSESPCIEQRGHIFWELATSPPCSRRRAAEETGSLLHRLTRFRSSRSSSRRVRRQPAAPPFSRSPFEQWGHIFCDRRRNESREVHRALPTPKDAKNDPQRGAACAPARPPPAKPAGTAWVHAAYKPPASGQAAPVPGLGPGPLGAGRPFVSS